jgi:Arc/MetJ family transcription regulator
MIPDDVFAAAMRALMVPEHEMVDSVARAILAERERERERCNEHHKAEFARLQELHGFL